MVITYFRQSMDQPGLVVNPARCQLNTKMNISLSQFSRLRILSDGFDRTVPRACSCFTLRLNLVLTHGIPPAF